MIAGYYRSQIFNHRAPHHIKQAITSEGLAQGPYMAV